MSLELSAEQKEVARKLSECDHPREVITDLNLSYEVNPDDCAEMRRAFKDGDKPRYKVARDDFDVYRTTVWKHALGNCGHEIDESPAKRVREDVKR